MKKVAIILTCLLLGMFPIYAQHMINGIVVDTEGKPLEKVSIRLKDSNQVSVTDSAGVFQFASISGEGQISISHLGYSDQVVHFNTKTSFIRITLLEVSQVLEEVDVNTGYQRIPKERATGSFVQIDNVSLNNRITTNVLERLDGIAPGLQFDNRVSGASPKINIRGINTLSEGLMQPLIVVDNFPFEGDISNINPNDVESVTLLKDAGASSIWGARAGNGVIVINMKKPITDQNMRVSVTANTTLGEKPNLYYYPRMNASDFIDVEMMLYQRGFYDNQLTDVNANRNVFSPVVNLLHRQEAGELAESDILSEIDNYRNVDYRDDMMRYFYRHSANQQYHVNLSGGNTRNAYRISTGYDNNLGSRIGNTLERFSLRATNTLRPIEPIEIQTVIGYTQSTAANNASTSTTYPIVPGGGKTSLYPYARLVGEHGEALAIPYQYNYNFIDTVGSGQLLDWKMRPYEELDFARTASTMRHLVANLNIGYRIVEGLKIEGLYAFEKQMGNVQTTYGAQSFYARNLINRFTQINGESVARIIPLGGIVNNSASEMESHRGRVQINLDKTLRGKHGITVFAGAEMLHRPEQSSGFRVYGYNEHLLTSQQVDYINPHPIYGGLASNSRIESFGGFNARLRRFLSFYSNGGYTYDNRYILSLSARRDASNLFGVATNDRWNPLWSAGLAWVASEEHFLKSIEGLDFLKLRGTYGHSGNSGGMASTLPIITYLTPTNAWVTNLPRAMVTTLPNPQLKWENVRMINIAVDFSLFAGRISGALEYYTKKSSDLITDDALDPTTGFTSIRRNVGEVRGEGFDIQLNSKNLDGSLKWNTTFLFSKSKSWVTKFYGAPLTSLMYTSHTGINLRPTLDKYLYPVFSYRFAGLDAQTGDPQGYLAGEISKEYSRLLADSMHHLVYHGTGLPPYYGSIQNSFRWKGVELFVNITYKFGHYFQRETINYQSLFNSWITHGDYERRWQQSGDELITSVPSLVYPANAARDNFYAYSEANIEKGDLIRLQDIRLAYTFSPHWLGKTFPIQVNMNANNVGLLWRTNQSKLDPDYINLPIPRSYTIGVSVNF